MEANIDWSSGVAHVYTIVAGVVSKKKLSSRYDWEQSSHGSQDSNSNQYSPSGIRDISRNYHVVDNHVAIVESLVQVELNKYRL